MITDTHCHIYKEYYNDIDSLMNELSKNNIGRIINNACDYKSSLEVIELSKKYDSMYFVLGVYPESDINDLKKVEELIKENLNNKKMLGIGEIGLDYHYEELNKEEQIKLFKSQMDLAERYNLPVIIHSRESTKDMINILKDYNVKGIIHCFNGSVETAKEYIKMGYLLGINGVITFKNCKLINVLKEIGYENIVFETDSPYLTPVPYRSETNSPKYLNEIIDFVSKELNVDKNILINNSNKNVDELFFKKYENI